VAGVRLEVLVLGGHDGCEALVGRNPLELWISSQPAPESRSTVANFQGCRMTQRKPVESATFANVLECQTEQQQSPRPLHHPAKPIPSETNETRKQSHDDCNWYPRWCRFDRHDRHHQNELPMSPQYATHQRAGPIVRRVGISALTTAQHANWQWKDENPERRHDKERPEAALTAAQQPHHRISPACHCHCHLARPPHTREKGREKDIGKVESWDHFVLLFAVSTIRSS
jgi:hypothetical protein